MYVSDQFAHCIGKVDLKTGVWQTFVGQCGKSGFANGTSKKALFKGPTALAFDSKSGALFIADTENHCIRRLKLNTQMVDTFVGECGSSGNVVGQYGQSIRFTRPGGILVEPGRRLLVVDTGNHQLKSVNFP